MDNLDKLVNQAYEDLKTEVKPVYREHFKRTLRSQFSQALFNSLEECDKMEEKAKKRK